MARCGCSTGCTCAVQAGDNVTVTGNGSAANPYVVSATAPTLVLDNTDTCVQLTGTGVAGDPLAVSLVIDPDVDNTLVCGSDGLFVPAGAGGAVAVADTTSVDMTLTGNTISAVVIVDPAGPLEIGPAGLTVDPGCGLEIVGGELQANTTPWPFACNQDTNAEDVYCSPADGRLQVKRTVHDGDTAAAVELSTGAIGGGGSRPTGVATIQIDTTALCEPILVDLRYLSRVNFTHNAGSSWRIFGTLTQTLNGGAAVVTVQDIASNAPADLGQTQDRRINHQTQFLLQPGFVHTIGYRVTLANDGVAGSPQISLIEAGAAIQATWTTQNP